MIGSCLNRIIIYTFLGIALLCSCEKKMKVVKNENYEQFAGKMIVMPTSRMKAVYNGEMVAELPIKHFPSRKEYNFIMYIGADNCSICTLQRFYRWDDMMDYVGRTNVEYYFIVQPDGKNDLIDLVQALNQNYFSHPVYFDESGSFEKANAAFTCTGTIGMLTKADGTILLSGNPMSSSGFIERVKQELIIFNAS